MSDLHQRDIRPCLLCGEGLMHSHQMTAYRVTIEHFVFDLGAIQRQAGLEQMLGGNAAIAHAMGPQEAMAKRATSVSALICQQCAMQDGTPLSVLAECAQDSDPENAA